MMRKKHHNKCFLLLVPLHYNDPVLSERSSLQTSRAWELRCFLIKQLRDGSTEQRHVRYIFTADHLEVLGKDFHEEATCNRRQIFLTASTDGNGCNIRLDFKPFTSPQLIRNPQWRRTVVVALPAFRRPAHTWGIVNAIAEADSYTAQHM